MDEKPKSNVLRIILIALVAIAGFCLLCYAGSSVIGRLGMSQLLMGQSTNVSEGGPPEGRVVEIIPPSETPTARERIPTATNFIPSDTPTPALPEAASCVPPNERVRGLVTKVLNGDAIEVVIRERTYRVRYIGSRTPQLGLESEPLALEAANFNRSLVLNQTVILVRDASEVDAQGYLLRYVIVGEAFVNHELLERGLARAESTPPDTACSVPFLAAQQEAVGARLGIWKDVTPTETPTPPLPKIPISPEPATVLPPAAACDCEGEDLDCSDFETRLEAQACFDACKAQGLGDVFLMDDSGNGLACEGKKP